MKSKIVYLNSKNDRFIIKTKLLNCSKKVKRNGNFCFVTLFFNSWRNILRSAEMGIRMLYVCVVHVWLFVICSFQVFYFSILSWSFSFWFGRLIGMMKGGRGGDMVLMVVIWTVCCVARISFRWFVLLFVRTNSSSFLSVFFCSLSPIRTNRRKVEWW